MSKDSERTLLQTLHEMDLLIPILNMAHISRLTDKNRSLFSNWYKQQVDMTSTKTRNEVRKTLLRILKEIHQETGRLIAESPDQRDTYTYLTETPKQNT